MPDVEIINSDCLEAMKQIDSGTVNLILTDPPYNIGKFMLERGTSLQTMRENFFVTAGWDNLGFSEWGGGNGFFL